MALIDELETLARLMRQLPEVEEEAERCQEAAKNALDNVAYVKEGIDEIRLRVCNLLMPPNIVVDGPQAPAQPVHPDELRSVTPATEEESGDQIGAPIERPWTLTGAFRDGYEGRKHVAPQHPVYMEQWQAGDEHRRIGEAEDAVDATPTVQPADLTVADLDAPEIPEGFTKWGGGGIAVGDDVKVEVMCRTGHKWDALGREIVWGHHEEPDDIIAYRIIEAPAPEQDASVGTSETTVGALYETPDAPEPEPIVPTTDLWQQGYNDKLNGFDPSLAEPEYTKGYEARALIEREHNETMERARFFEGGMMADADRHQSDQRSIVEKVFDAFKSKEPA